MAYDEGLAQRLEEHFAQQPDIDVKKMFGGLCFMRRGHMCCGIVGDLLMARVGPDQYNACLAEPSVREMDFTGRAMKGMVYVEPAGFESDEDLLGWIARCETFVDSLPPKPPKPLKPPKAPRKRG